MSLNFAEASDRLAKSKISHPGLMQAIWGRIASRIKRFARLRSTAFPIERPADTANRVLPSSLGKATNTRSGWAKDFPNRRTRLKSFVPVRRNLRCTLWAASLEISGASFSS